MRDTYKLALLGFFCAGLQGDGPKCWPSSHGDRICLEELLSTHGPRAAKGKEQAYIVKAPLNRVEQSQSAEKWNYLQLGNIEVLHIIIPHL